MRSLETQKYKPSLILKANVDVKRISVSLFVGIMVLLTGQVFVNEFLTSFDVEISETPNFNGRITLQNIGVIQAHDVTAYVVFSEIPKITGDDCLEGIIHTKDKTIIVHLEKMSTNIVCVVHIDKFLTANVTITSIDRTAHTGAYTEFWSLFYFIVTLLFICAGLLIFVIYNTVRISYYRAVLYFRCKGFVPIDCNDDICSDLKKEFSIAISSEDASILCNMCNKKSTLHQLKTHTKLSRSYILYRIEYMRCNELIEKHENIPSEFIRNYFRQK